MDRKIGLDYNMKIFIKVIFIYESIYLKDFRFNMPKRDILLYNSASRGFTTNLKSDGRIQGSSDELLSIQNSSGTEQLKVGTSKTSFNF